MENPIFAYLILNVELYWYDIHFYFQGIIMKKHNYEHQSSFLASLLFAHSEIQWAFFSQCCVKLTLIFAHIDIQNSFTSI